MSECPAPAPARADEGQASGHQASGGQASSGPYTVPLPDSATEYWAIDLTSKGAISRSHALTKVQGSSPRTRTMEPFESNEIRIVFIRMQPSLEQFKFTSHQLDLSDWIIFPHSFTLWDRHRSGAYVRLQTPLIRYPTGEKPYEDNENTVFTNKLLLLPRISILWEGTWTQFQNVPSRFQFNWNDNGSFEAEIRLFDARAGRQHNPVEEPFQTLIRHPLSATALYNGNPDFGAQLLALDYYHVHLSCWIDFLKAFLGQIEVPGFDAHLWGKVPADRNPKWGYVNQISWFRRGLKNRICAIEMAARAIRLSASGLESPPKNHIERVLLSSEGECLRANLLMERIEDFFNSTRDISESQRRQRQEAGVKLLTWIACIFLPLSTASSLLSMSSRVKDIGSVWWDWLSIVFIAALVVLQGYTWTMKSYTLKQSHVFFVIRKIFNNALKETLKHHGRKHLIHPGVQSLLTLSIFAFTLGTLTAFLIGTFVRLETGAEVLGLSAAGALGLIVGPLLVWRFVNLYLWVARSIWSTSWIWPIHFPAQLVPSSDTGDHMLGIGIILGSLYASVLLFFPLLLTSLVTGSIIFELIYKMVMNSAKMVRTLQVKKNTRNEGKDTKSKGKTNAIEDMDKEETVDIDQAQEVLAM